MSNRYLNMDIVRYILALAVIVAHFNIVTGTNIPFPIRSGTAVGVFFGLSGYLVYGSYLRHPDFYSYVCNRMKRILPPYLFIILLSAFGLCAVSKLSFWDYFTSDDFWKYLFANITFLNFIQPNLPGVFTDMCITAVNGSLWTLKVEWTLYLTIPLFFWGVKKYRWNVPIAVIIICLCSEIYNKLMLHVAEMTGNDSFKILSYQFVGQLSYFYTGVLVYHFKDKLANRHWQCVFPVVLISYIFFECNVLNADNMFFDALAPIVLTAVTLLFSISRRICTFTSLLGNISYEMYLFHFPIIQLCWYLKVARSLPVYLYFGCVLMTIVLLSVTFQRTWKKISVL